MPLKYLLTITQDYSKAEAWRRAAKECNFESGDAAKMQVRRHMKNRTQLREHLVV